MRDAAVYAVHHFWWKWNLLTVEFIKSLRRGKVGHAGLFPVAPYSLPSSYSATLQPVVSADADTGAVCQPVIANGPRSLSSVSSHALIYYLIRGSYVCEIPNSVTGYIDSPPYLHAIVLEYPWHFLTIRGINHLETWATSYHLLLLQNSYSWILEM